MNRSFQRALFVIFLALGVARIAWWLVVLRPTPTLASEEAQQIAAQFLEQIRTGRLDEAWASTSTDFKSLYGRERFRLYVQSKPVLKGDCRIESCEFPADTPLPLARCLARPVTGSPSPPASGSATPSAPAGGGSANRTSRIEIVLHPEGNQWKVGRLHVE